MKKSRKKMIWIILLFVILLVAAAVLIFFNQPRFGKTPGGEKKERIVNSPNYKEGKFQNLSETPQITSDKNYFSTMVDFLFRKKERLNPEKELPSVKTDLSGIGEEDVLVWFGHSSYFIRIDGKNILVDPVLSGAASPVSFVNKPFKGTDIYKPTDIPDVDYLIITHDHWDHLDYNTVLELKPRIKNIVCSLGVGEHFGHWGFSKDMISELDWNETRNLGYGFSIDCLPARHFSGRGFSPNQSLWVSYLLRTPSMKIYIGGDSGYDKYYKEIGNKYGKIDLAVLENGQYDKNWRYIHLFPEETVQASKDLNAGVLFTVHNSKFALSNHAWDAPMKAVSEIAEKEGVKHITPMIGEKVNLKDSIQEFKQWWLGIE